MIDLDPSRFMQKVYMAAIDSLKPSQFHTLKQIGDGEGVYFFRSGRRPGAIKIGMTENSFKGRETGNRKVHGMGYIAACITGLDGSAYAVETALLDHFDCGTPDFVSYSVIMDYLEGECGMTGIRDYVPDNVNWVEYIEDIQWQIKCAHYDMGYGYKHQQESGVLRLAVAQETLYDIHRLINPLVPPAFQWDNTQLGTVMSKEALIVHQYGATPERIKEMVNKSLNLYLDDPAVSSWSGRQMESWLQDHRTLQSAYTQALERN